MTALGRTYVRHGWTMDELIRLAGEATALKFRHLRFISVADAKEAAWFGIVELLCVRNSQPTRRELLDAGIKAIRDENRSNQISHGQPSGGGNGKQFITYWMDSTQDPGPSPDLVDSAMTLKSVWGGLSDQHRSVLAAKAAAFTDYEPLGTETRAARLAGINPKRYAEHLREAQQAAKELWFDGDSVPHEYKGSAALSQRIRHRNMIARNARKDTPHNGQAA